MFFGIIFNGFQMDQRTAILALLYIRRRRRQRIRNYYVRPPHLDNQICRFDRFWQNYRQQNSSYLQEFCRLTPHMFDLLYERLQRKLDSHLCTHKLPIVGQERLAVFLRRLNIIPF